MTSSEDGLEDLQDRLGYRFVDVSLLKRALTHRSHGQSHNERLEFLGDSVLNCVVAGSLFRRYPDLDEGHLSRLRAGLVRQQTLSDVAEQLDLSRALVLGEGERKTGGARRPSILADALEAVIGAVYVDAGFERAEQIVCRLFEGRIAAIDQAQPGKDPKTQLQEWAQARALPLPVYVLQAALGAAHAQRFEVVCRMTQPEIEVSGTGSSRRAAEQLAAQAALERIHASIDPASSRRRASRAGRAHG